MAGILVATDFSKLSRVISSVAESIAIVQGKGLIHVHGSASL